MPPYDSNFLELLVRRASENPGATALRWKRYGIWRRYTWSDYAAYVEYVALALRERGVRPGTRVAFMTGNRPSWLFYELGAQALGALPLGIYEDSLPVEASYLLDYSGARIVLVENQEHLDKILEAVKEAPHVELVLVDEEKGLYRYRGSDPSVEPFSSLLEEGKRISETEEGFLEKRARSIPPTRVSGLYSTSGTTGKPKLAMLTYRNMLSMAHQLRTIDPVSDGYEYFSFLPTPWVGEQMMSIAMALLTGMKVNFPERRETLWSDFREIGPHVVFAPPRIWERIASEVEAKIRDSDPVKKAFYRAALRIGRRCEEKGNPPYCRALRFLAYWMALRAVLDKYGLKRLRRAYTGGAMLGPEYFSYFRALGVNLKQIYGQTECSGIAVVHRDGRVRPETVGEPLPETRVRISREGEILIKSPAVMIGYYRNPKATLETLRDGWLHTGDAGYMTGDGQLVVLDRLKHMVRLADGTPVAPQYVENMLKFSPYIREAVVFGENRPYLVAVVCIDYETVARWAEHRGIPYTSYSDLSQKDEVLELIRSEASRVNSMLPEKMRVRRVASLFKELSADDGELTRTGKVRRRAVREKYRRLVEAMYRGESSVELTVDVVLEDGTVKRVTRKTRILEVG